MSGAGNRNGKMKIEVTVGLHKEKKPTLEPYKFAIYFMLVI